VRFFEDVDGVDGPPAAALADLSHAFVEREVLEDEDVVEQRRARRGRGLDLC
jgi:hypothetical protein